MLLQISFPFECLNTYRAWPSTVVTLDQMFFFSNFSPGSIGDRKKEKVTEAFLG